MFFVISLGAGMFETLTTRLLRLKIVGSITIIAATSMFTIVANVVSASVLVSFSQR